MSSDLPFRRPLVVGAGLLAFILARPAFADDGAAAEALFEAGRAAAKRGDTSGACARFRESYRLDPASGTKLNLAVCEAELGRLAVAWRLLRSLDQTLTPEDPRAEVVRLRLAELDPRVPRVTFEGNMPLPSQLRVILNGAAITASGFGVPIPVDPGEHIVEIRWPGQPSTQKRFVLAEGDRRVIAIEPPRAKPSPKAVPAERARSAESSRKTWTILSFGAASTAFAVSAVAGLGALRRKHEVDRLCDAGGCDPGGTDAARDGDTLATVSTVSVALGAALAGVGITLLVTDGNGRSRGGAALSVSASGFTLAAVH